jgi:hypothetical protein
MKLIFKDEGYPWIIDKKGNHPEVEGCLSITVPEGFNLIASEKVVEDELVRTYKTLPEIQAELA